MKLWARRFSLILLAAGLAFCLSGCLSARYFTMVRYDDAKDEFTILNVYQGIDAPSAGDGEYLFQLWRNRDHLIRVPNIDILAMPAFLRLSATEYAPINLGQAPPTLDKTKTPVSLDQIRVLPGTFFLRGTDTLCYYDQVILPGKVIDQALQQIGPAIAPDLTKAIDEETQRRKAGGKLLDWDETRQQMIAGVHSSVDPSAAPAGPAPDSPEAKQGPLSLLDEQSLALLRKGANDGAIKLTREKQVFRLTVPLSDADVAQVEKTWKAAADAVKADGPNSPAGSPTFVTFKLLPAFKLSTQAHAVELEINLPVIIAILPELASITQPLEEPTPDKLKSMASTIAALRARGVAIDEKLTVEQLAKDFTNQTVKSYPSEHPVEPGTGLAQAPPAKQ
ncbi:MAG TPA: hypothetical protein VFE47_10000 [Tepidisphaeraceae bacterium]|jgi:hypothetical protein|nr:hypothetical protein [Tepidisphaeraceae bacterium]